VTGELILLNVLLATLFVLGPLATNLFFLNSSISYKRIHLSVISTLTILFFLKITLLNIIWLLFCVYGFFLFIFKNKDKLFSIEKIASLIPLTFSIISALWFFCGSNDLYLLGYNINWSYYAALHAGFLGWLLLASFIVISRKTKFKKLYLYSCFVFLVSFLLIALGIDGIPYIKRVGALIIVFASPLLVGFYTFKITRAYTFSKYLSFLSLILLCFSLFLAFENEFLITLVSPMISNKPMVFLHGSINGLVAIPALIFSLIFESKNL